MPDDDGRCDSPDHLLEAILTTGIVPESIQSNNGSCHISQEYRSLLEKLESAHHLIHHYCSQEKADIERYHRTVRELVDVDNAETSADLEEVAKERIHYHNNIQYQSKIGFIPPYVKYRGNANQIFEEQKKKFEKDRIKRMEINAQSMMSKTQNIES